MASCDINLVLNAEISGTTATHIGSARILTGSNTVVSFRGMFGSSIEDNQTGTLEVKRYTGGATITELKASGIGLQDISGSSILLPGPDANINNDWYDFYASGSQGDASVLIKGIKIVLQ
jgi:hypothetical protein